MTVKFIVDDLNDDKTLGRTKSIDKILHNIKRFSPDYYPKFMNLFNKGKGVSSFTIVGRFIVYLSINPTMTHGDLIFFDTEKNIDKALDTVIKLFENDLNKINGFMKMHADLEKHYDRDYDLAEISLGDSILN